MKKVQESQVKSALIAAKQILEERDNLFDFPGNQTGSLKSLNILSNKKNSEQILTSFLTKTGFEFEKFDTIREQNQTRLKQETIKAKADAVKNSTFIQDANIQNIANWKNSLENILTDIGPANPNFNVAAVNTPFLVWPSHGLILDDPHIEPWKNSAKFRINSTSASNGSETLTFYFLWENPSSKYAVTNIGSSLILNGYCEISADGGTAGIVPGGNSSLNLDARLTIYDWTAQPPVPPFPQNTQTNHILTLSADGGGWFESVGAIEYTTAKGNFDLGYNLFLLPPHGVGVFEVVLSFSYQNKNAQIDEIDFESGDFQVLCPAVLVTVLS
ncbi:MAG: hypothetical protein WAM24_19285 [Ignavibacteriaceae bacterium]